MQQPIASLCVHLHQEQIVNTTSLEQKSIFNKAWRHGQELTCSNILQYLSQADELQVRERILAANFLRFGALLPWLSHHLANLGRQSEII